MRYILITIAIIVLFVACDEPPKPNHIVEKPRILAIKVDPPEILTGETLTAKLLIGGPAFDQTSDYVVTWGGDEKSGLQLPLISQSNQIAYNQTFSALIPDIDLSDFDIDDLPDEAKELLEKVTEDGFIDLPMNAAIMVPFEIDGQETEKLLQAQKFFRIYLEDPQQEIPKNPEIKSVTIKWEENEQMKTVVVKDGETGVVPLAVFPDFVSFSAQMVDQKTTNNDKHIFRWFFTDDVDLDQYMRTTRSKGLAQKYEDVNLAVQNTEKMVLDFKKVKKDYKEKNLSKDLSFNFYLVVRDKADNPRTRDDYHFGLDFMTFRLVLSDTPEKYELEPEDNDMLPDEDGIDSEQEENEVGVVK